MAQNVGPGLNVTISINFFQKTTSKLDEMARISRTQQRIQIVCFYLKTLSFKLNQALYKHDHVNPHFGPI